MTTDNENLTFGKRFGLEPLEVPFQIDTIDKVLRTELWNAHYIYVQRPIECASNYHEASFRSINQVLWVHFFKKAFDDFPRYNSEFGAFVRKFIEQNLWYKVYEFFEFLLFNLNTDERNDLFEYYGFEKYINEKLRDLNSQKDLLLLVVPQHQVMRIKM